MKGTKAESTATSRAEAAVVAALAPLSVANFQHAADVSVNLAVLRKIESWFQGEIIEKGGWAVVADPKASEQRSQVARARAELLTKA